MSKYRPNDRKMPEKENKEYERRLVWIVRFSAVAMCVLLLAFFYIVIRNTSFISSQVEYVKNSPYPISVAAGHIETDLVHLQTFIESESSYQLGASNESKQEKADSLNAVLSDLNRQLETIKNSARRGDIEVERMERLLKLLESRAETFNLMCWSSNDSQNNYEEAMAFARANLNPVITIMLETNNEALETTSNMIEEMYADVNNSVSVLFTFAIIMSIAVLAVGIILLVVISIKGRLEKGLQETLKEALQENERANEAKSAFMANMSHDIRTPMNAIVGLTQIASENINDPVRVKQCLTRITTSSQHLLSLINDVLDMNKIESGKVTLSKEVFSLSCLASEIETLFKSQPDSMRRQSEVVIKNLYADLLMGDAMRLRQILLNLVSNALKYTNEGDMTRLLVEERPTAKDGMANVTFVVEDSGIGMKKDFIKRIFEPFERENNDFTIFTEGTGLGMAITKNLVDLMGGTINVESDLGIGTRVTISIDFEIAPDDFVVDQGEYVQSLANEIDANGHLIVDGFGKSDEERDSEGSDSAPEPVQEKEPSCGSIKKVNKEIVEGNVLIVEDNEINMEIAKQLINSRGATVDEAFDGLEAVKKINCSKEGEYDLIFMDWQMPHMNGIEATKSIRKFLDEHGRDQIPIVAMTANAFESDKETALQAGMNDFMAKPINIRQLEDVLKEYLRKRG